MKIFLTRPVTPPPALAFNVSSSHCHLPGLQKGLLAPEVRAGWTRGCLGKDPGRHHWGRAPPVLEHRGPQLWALGHGSACLLCPCPSLSGTPWSTQILTQSCAPDVTYAGDKQRCYRNCKLGSPESSHFGRGQAKGI